MTDYYYKYVNILLHFHDIIIVNVLYIILILAQLPLQHDRIGG
jgi:hypothetical protein